MEPIYSFTVPSIGDDTPIGCRIYHPKRLSKRLQRFTPPVQGLCGAVLAHPYAPLGGCSDDPVVLSSKETLLQQGIIVITFNFRGAGDSEGHTSWTGKGELDDFSSVVGLVVYYLHHLTSVSQDSATVDLPMSSVKLDSTASTSLLLGGYSFGALILARLPPVERIIQRFEAAERGTAASEIFLRARILAKQTLASFDAAQGPRKGRVDETDPPRRTSRARASPVTVGGAETTPRDRHRSKDSRRSTDIAHEAIPQRIRSQLRKHSSGSSKHSIEQYAPTTVSTHHPPIATGVSTRYLLISPVLLPLTSTLLPPGLPSMYSKVADNSTTGFAALQSPTYIVFGSADSFSSAKRLRQWAERLSSTSLGQVQWEQIEDAGHFWREDGVMSNLQSSIASWLTRSSALLSHNVTLDGTE